MRLQDAPPTEARILLALVPREAVFRGRVGEQGSRLRQIAVLGRPTGSPALSSDQEAATAAYRVGYDNNSHFGQPPI